MMHTQLRSGELCVIQISGVPVPCRGGGGDYHFFEKKSVIILGSGKILSDNPEDP